MNYKVLFLDWNGTLSDSLFWEHLRKSESLQDKQLFELWDDALFINNKEEMYNWMRGLRTTEEMLKKVSIKTDMSYDLILKEFIQGCKKASFSSNKLPGIIGKLRSKDIYTVIATDNMDCFNRWTVPELKLDNMFNEVINSYYQKALKRDKGTKGRSMFFKDFFQRNKFSPAECVFIDDSEDREGFLTSLGIKYIQIDSSAEAIKAIHSVFRDLI